MPTWVIFRQYQQCPDNLHQRDVILPNRARNAATVVDMVKMVPGRWLLAAGLKTWNTGELPSGLEQPIKVLSFGFGTPDAQRRVTET